MGQQTLREPAKAAAMPLNLNLTIFGLIGLMVIILFAFLGRGLYFRPELFTGLMVIAVVFAFAAADTAVRGETDYYRFPVDYLITALAMVYLLSAGKAVSKPDAVIGAMKYTAYLMVFFITCQSVRKWQSYRSLLEFIFAGTVIVALVGLLSATRHINFPGAYYQKVVQSTLQYKNALAILMAAGSVISLSLWASSKKSTLHNLWYLEGLLMLNITLLGAQSRAVWVIYPVLLLLWIVGLQKNDRSKIFLPVCYVLIASILVSRGFFSRVEDGRGQAALLLLLGGSLTTLAGWMVIRRINHLTNKKPIAPAVRKFWQGVGVVYLVVVLAVYGFYAVRSLPGGWDAVVPAAVTEKMPTVTGYDPNFQARLLYSRDALKIVGDYPLLGAGAEGWKALYHIYRSEPYATEEIHNGFLQVAVDTGIPGVLIYISIWAVTLYSAYRLIRHFRKDPQWPLVWGAIVTLLAILLHSSFDFDLSFPTLSILTWILFALVRNGHGLARGNRQEKTLRTGPRWLALILGIALAAVMLVLPYRLYQAGGLGAAGAQAMAAGELGIAEKKMREATVKDPYNGAYLADLAKINLVYWLKDGDKERLTRGLAMARQAVEKEPYNILLRESLIKCYLSAGMIDEAIGEAEGMAAGNPLEIKAYEVLASTGVDGAMYYRQKGEVVRSLVYLNKVVGIPVEMDKQRNKVFKTSGKAYRYVGLLPMTSRLNTAVGQAYMLTGRPEKGIPLLENAVKDKKPSWEAAAWLAAAYKSSGNTQKADKLIQKASDKNFDLIVERVVKILQKTK